MALTRPRYGQHLQPIARRDIHKHLEPKEPNNIIEKYNDLTCKRRTLPAISTKSTHQLHTCSYCARKILESHDYEYIYRNSRPQDLKSHRTTNKTPIRSYSSAEEAQNKVSILGRKRSASTDFLQYLDRRSKHVSFSLPMPPANQTKASINHKEKLTTISNKPYHSCNLENTTFSKYNLSEIKTKVLSQEDNRSKNNSKLSNETIKSISKRNRKNLPPLAEKIRQRRRRVEEPKAKVIVYEEPSVLQRARQALLFKMQNPRKSELPTRRVLHLPALAAPCSEEFVITMRRLTQGHRFVSSPAVFNHVTKMSVPLGASEALFDAMLRPSSSLSPLKISH